VIWRINIIKPEYFQEQPPAFERDGRCAAELVCHKRKRVGQAVKSCEEIVVRDFFVFLSVVAKPRNSEMVNLNSERRAFPAILENE
jgi:hypothetical protein